MVRLIRRRLDARHSDERGAYAVVVALIGVLLLGMTALGVDYSNVRLLRTQAQNSADAAVLAGAQDLPNESIVAQTVKQYALDNFNIAFSAWNSCTDNNALEEPLVGSADTACISTDVSHSRLRVKLPTTYMKTWFGRALSIAEAPIQAIAEAEVLLQRDNRIIPATVTSTSGTGHMCIERSGANTPCVGSITGNFASIESPRVFIHTVDPQNKADALRINYSMGVDHQLTPHVLNSPKVCDGTVVDPCGTNLSNLVDNSLVANHLNFSTGNNTNTVTEGLVTGADIATNDGGTQHFCGRLQRPNLTADNVAQPTPTDGCIPTAPTITKLGTTINGHHISMWMTATARAAFYPEIGNSNPPVGSLLYLLGDRRLRCYTEQYRAYAALPNCSDPSIGLAVSPPAPLFAEDILTDPRFGKIPVICAAGTKKNACTFPPGQSGVGRLVGFWGAFLYNLEENTGDQKIQAVDGWIFDLSLIQTSEDLEYGFQSSPVVHLAK